LRQHLLTFGCHSSRTNHYAGVRRRQAEPYVSYISWVLKDCWQQFEDFSTWHPDVPTLNSSCRFEDHGGVEQVTGSSRCLTAKKSSGFSSTELLIVLGLILIVTVMSIPSLRRTLDAYRGSAAIHGIAGQISLSRMRAASDFTKTKLVIDTTNQTYVRQIYNKTSGNYDNEGGTQSLGQGVSFGFGTITSPAGGQSSISQTTEIIFNSRGIPIDTGGTPIGTDAIYLNNNAGAYYVVSVNTTGQIRTWQYYAGAWVTE
jgi:Tfp pilus assembly protein FimT